MSIDKHQKSGPSPHKSSPSDLFQVTPPELLFPPTPVSSPKWPSSIMPNGAVGFA